jgi:hypothetical protein
MNRNEILKIITNKSSKTINKSTNFILKKILENILDVVSKILVVPPLVFTGIMSVGMLILVGMSLFSINLLPDFIHMLDTKLIIGTIGILTSIGFAFASIIGWPLYIITLIGGIWFIKTYRRFIKNNQLYIKANDFVDRV